MRKMTMRCPKEVFDVIAQHGVLSTGLILPRDPQIQFEPSLNTSVEEQLLHVYSTSYYVPPNGAVLDISQGS